MIYDGSAIITTSKSGLKIFNLDAIASFDANEKIKVLGVFGVSRVNFENKITLALLDLPLSMNH